MFTVLDMTCAQDSDCSTKLTNTVCSSTKCACANNYVKEDVACKKGMYRNVWSEGLSITNIRTWTFSNYLSNINDCVAANPSVIFSFYFFLSVDPKIHSFLR
jgi:hypothetical protein